MRETYVSGNTNKVNTTFGPMSYIDSGTGPALVFIHGWPMQKETFLPITRILQKDFRCICFDLIDIGESRPSTAPTPLSFLARSPMDFGGCFANKDLIHGEFFSLTAKPLIENPEKLAGCLRFLKSMDWNECERLSQVHTQINAKVHCIWGEADPFFPVSEAREMFQKFANPGEFVTIKNAKLLPYAEYPKESAAFIHRFMQP
jgi:pimeloyl-ACP methyl ester carboxylesterase